MCSADIFLGLLAILFPPLPVWVKRGICSVDSLINILLCTLGFLPGLIHAWYIIAKFPEPGYDYEPLQQDAEGQGHGRVYVIVHDASGRPTQQRVQQPQGPRPDSKKPKPNANMSYGTTSAPAAQNNNAGEGSSGGAAPPPSYAQVVAGDHKVQTQE